jgi:hypothetical protein
LFCFNIGELWGQLDGLEFGDRKISVLEVSPPRRRECLFHAATIEGAVYSNVPPARAGSWCTLSLQPVAGRHCDGQKQKRSGRESAAQLPETSLGTS